MSIHFPTLSSNEPRLNSAARIAAGDIAGNCMPFCDGLLTESRTCVMAGLDYDTPWTRDAAINTMNALCFFDKEISKNTLLAVCCKMGDEPFIAGQYWDCIIWALGAWQYLAVNPDPKFASFALKTIQNSLEHLEDEEFNKEIGLFRGAAVYGDGIAAYPDKYTNTVNNQTGILDWPGVNPASRCQTGYGIPIFALSTNCVYYAAYKIAAALCTSESSEKQAYSQKAQNLQKAINRHFWNKSTGRYDYLFDDTLRCDHAEALGLAFSILFGIADASQCQSILKNTHITEHGIACVWPSFSRYRLGSHYGRHSGTVWPHAQGFWALACLRSGHHKGFDHEFWSLSEKACRDMQFAEIYHPITGMQYGGVQETTDRGIAEWASCNKQTWSATAYWAMIFYGLLGLEFSQNSFTFHPYLPEGIDQLVLRDLKIGSGEYTVLIERNTVSPTFATISKFAAGKQTIKLSYHATNSI